MVFKEVLLQKLKRCLDEEEGARAHYARSKEDPAYFSEFQTREQERLKGLLLLLEQEASTHVVVFKRLIKTVEEAKQDAF